MASLDRFEDDPQGQLMEELGDVRCVMLGTPNPDLHMQPMSPMVDEDTQEIYFYSDRTSELGQSILKQSAEVHMCLIEKDYQACVKGTLSVNYDPETIDRFWNPVVAAWYPDGKKDSKLLMLKFQPRDAAIWANDKSKIGFMYEIAKANLTDTTPDVGKMKEVKL